MDFKAPEIDSGKQFLMNVHAVALKNLDKIMASGKSYVSYGKLPAIVGSDGVGTLADGTKVFARANGTFAEQVAISSYIILPQEIDWVVAAALPNAAFGAGLSLKKRAQIKKGDVVLINGGTGVTGKMAIQLARYYGASKIIVSGFVEHLEADKENLGIDELISTRETDGEIIKRLREINEDSPITVVLDYLWGRSAELILQFLMGTGGRYMEQETRFVQVGSLSGDEIKLSANTMRSSKVQIMGSGMGSHTQDDFRYFDQELLPEIFQWAVAGKLSIDTIADSLRNIGELWNKNPKGKRIVLKI